MIKIKCWIVNILTMYIYVYTFIAIITIAIAGYKYISYIIHKEILPIAKYLFLISILNIYTLVYYLFKTSFSLINEIEKENYY